MDGLLQFGVVAFLNCLNNRFNRLHCTSNKSNHTSRPILKWRMRVWASPFGLGIPDIFVSYPRMTTDFSCITWLLSMGWLVDKVSGVRSAPRHDGRPTPSTFGILSPTARGVAASPTTCQLDRISPQLSTTGRRRCKATMRIRRWTVQRSYSARWARVQASARPTFRQGASGMEGNIRATRSDR